jgi:putative endonuclease
VAVAVVGTDVADCTWYVYMILTNKNCLYTGIARDVQRRLREHEEVAQGRANARGAKYFRTQKPVRVVYTEAFPDRSQALRQERLIKALSAVQKRKLCVG